MGKATTTAKAMGLVLVAAVAILVLTVSVWAFRYFTAETRGIIDAEEQIESAPSRIANYSWFYEMCHSVMAHNDMIENQRARLENEPDDSVRSRIRANIAGIQSQQARAIQRYNARARQSYTAARFRASDLPFEIDSNTDC